MELTDDFVLDRIEELCKKKGFSHYRLAMRSGVHQSSLSTMFNRKSTPNVFTLQRICDGLGITLAEFFSPEDAYAGLTEEENNLLTMYDQMNDTQRGLVNAYIQGLKDASKN